MSKISKIVTFKALDEDQRIAYGEVFVPNVLDTHGEFMDAADIQKMAERFMALEDRDQRIDTMHDNVSNGCYPVESFIADGSNPLWTAGAWVMGIKFPDKELWQKVKSGQLNGYSFEAMVRKVPVIVEVEYEPQSIGITEETLGHTHLFFLELNEDGVVVGGRTSTDYGHSHSIKDGTATADELGHSHRFVF